MYTCGHACPQGFNAPANDNQSGKVDRGYVRTTKLLVVNVSVLGVRYVVRVEG